MGNIKDNNIHTRNKDKYRCETIQNMHSIRQTESNAEPKQKLITTFEDSRWAKITQFTVQLSYDNKIHQDIKANGKTCKQEAKFESRKGSKQIKSWCQSYLTFHYFNSHSIFLNQNNKRRCSHCFTNVSRFSNYPLNFRYANLNYSSLIIC